MNLNKLKEKVYKMPLLTAGTTKNTAMPIGSVWLLRSLWRQ